MLNAIYLCLLNRSLESVWRCFMKLKQLFKQKEFKFRESSKKNNSNFYKSKKKCSHNLQNEKNKFNKNNSGKS